MMVAASEAMERENRVIAAVSAWPVFLGMRRKLYELLSEHLSDSANPFGLKRSDVNKYQFDVFNGDAFTIHLEMVFRNKELIPVGKISFVIWEKGSFLDLYLDMKGGIYHSISCEGNPLHNVHHHYRIESLIAMILEKYLQTKIENPSS